MKRLSLKDFTESDKLCKCENAHYTYEDDSYLIHLSHRYYQIDKHKRSQRVWVADIVYKTASMESTEFMHNRLKETMGWVNMILSLH